VPGSITLPRLLLVTDRHATRGRELGTITVDAIRAGLRFVQLREKDLGDEALLRIGERLRAAMPADGAVVVNGRPAVAEGLGAGLHLPASAAPVPLSGHGPRGRSVHGPAELAAALAEGVDYVVAGNVYDTTSKPGLPGRGPGWLEEICRAAGETPVFAIGGVDAGRILDVLRAGAFGIAVRDAVLRASDPARAVRELLAEIERCAGALR